MYYLLFIPFAYGIMRITAIEPQITELLYSKFIYTKLIIPLQFLSSKVAFSIGELLLYLFLLYLLLALIRSIFKFSIKQLVQTVLAPIAVLYLFFVLLWGINYNRLPFSEIANLNVEKSSVKELYALCETLVADANRLSLSTSRNKQKNTEKELYEAVFAQASSGYEVLEDTYPFIPSDQFSDPKPIRSSRLLSYTGICGIYSPFTGEANVNVSIPYMMLASTTTHEMAHQRGFAREDEANFIGYLACMNNESIDFQYSGTMLALLHSMNQLYAHDAESYAKLVSTYNDIIREDFLYWSEFWKEYEGRVEEISGKVNDGYLKSNLQKDGTQSYGRMVDLLIAYYKK